MLTTIYKAIVLSTFMASSICIAAETNTNTSNNSKLTSKILDPHTYLIDARATQAEEVKDPFQGINRTVYTFNDIVDRNLLRPVAVAYVETIPEPAQGAYSNFRKNLREPWNAVNQLLQGKPKQSAKSLGRFTINTLTSLGFADPAKRLNLVQSSESFGTTLGVWGVPSGPYLVLPFLGSSSIRDTIGLIPDAYARPQGYFIDQDQLRWTNTALEITATRAQYLGVDSILQGDKYAAMRDVYLQQRAFEIAQKRGEDLSQSMFTEDPFEDDYLDEEIEEQDVDLEPETTE